MDFEPNGKPQEPEDEIAERLEETRGESDMTVKMVVGFYCIVLVSAVITVVVFLVRGMAS